MMGSGKTSAAINYMNAHEEQNFVYIAPYLEEASRIWKGCKARGFVEPQVSWNESKLANIKKLYEDKCNIASTHALFQKYDEQIVQLIRGGNYTLVLDEVADVVQQLPIAECDLELLLRTGLITVGDDNRVYWNDEEYGQNGWASALMRTIQTGNVLMLNGKLMVWVLPMAVFTAFEHIIVLTHMFASQLQRCYYDMFGAEYKYISVRKTGDTYMFCECDESNLSYAWLRDKIHIFDNAAFNAIGDTPFSLSSNWFDAALATRGQPKLERLKLNAEYINRHYWNGGAGQTMWSTYIKAQKAVMGHGMARSFVEYNCRATNQYRSKTQLMYMCNIFFVPEIRNYFTSQGIEVDEDGYALSIMIQWIWRSAIRMGQDVWIYVPSHRMRDLLTNWLGGVQ